MRAILLAAAGLLAVGAVGSAHAADMGPPMLAKAPPPPPAWFNWTGFYIGANGGGGSFNDSARLTATTPFGNTVGGESGGGGGGFGGGQIGFNWQFDPHWVAGVEADIDWANLTGSGNLCNTYTTGPFAGFTASCGTSNSTIDEFNTVRGRLGFAWNNVLLYGTGGVAWLRDSTTSRLTCFAAPGFPCPGVGVPAPFFTSTPGTSNTTELGWVVGGGVEVGLWTHWILRAEYLHLQVNNFGFTATSSGTLLGVPFAIPVGLTRNLEVDTFRLGVSYLFNFGGPMMAMQ
jgi:outer membrane immunogenic protein